MSEWKEYKLGDLCDVSIGRTPPRNEFKWFNQDSHSYKWVSIKDMGKSTKYLYNTSETITVEGQKEFNIPIVPNNTVILSFKLTLGRVAITGNEDMLTNEAIAQLPIKNERVLNIEYLYYYLKNFNYDTLGNTSSIATAVNSKTIKNLPVVVPPYEKQLVIVSILSEIDKKIECNNKTCTNLEAQAQALFKHWFVDFAPFKDGKFVESVLGLIPEGWRVGTIGDIAELRKPSIKPQDNIIYTHYSIPAFDNCKKPSIDEGSTIKSNKFGIYDGAVLLSKLNPSTKRIWYTGNVPGNSVSSTEFLPFYSKNKVFTPFIYCYLNCDSNYREIANGAKGTTNSHQRIDANSILNRALAYSEGAIREFCDCCQNQLDLILEANQESLRLSTLRDTLLPKLMSGEIKVNEVEKSL